MDINFSSTDNHRNKRSLSKAENVNDFRNRGKVRGHEVRERERERERVFKYIFSKTLYFVENIL